MGNDGLKKNILATFSLSYFCFWYVFQVGFWKGESNCFLLLKLLHISFYCIPNIWLLAYTKVSIFGETWNKLLVSQDPRSLSAPIRISSETTHIQKTLHLCPEPSIEYQDLQRIFIQLPHLFHIQKCDGLRSSTRIYLSSIILKLSAKLSTFH